MRRSRYYERRRVSRSRVHGENALFGFGSVLFAVDDPRPPPGSNDSEGRRDMGVKRRSLRFYAAAGVDRARALRVSPRTMARPRHAQRRVTRYRPTRVRAFVTVEVCARDDGKRRGPLLRLGECLHCVCARLPHELCDRRGKRRRIYKRRTAEGLPGEQPVVIARYRSGRISSTQ